MTSVYLDFHRGNGEPGRIAEENRQRSMFYRERSRKHEASLGLRNDPEDLKTSVQGESYQYMQQSNTHFLDSVKQQEAIKKVVGA